MFVKISKEKFDDFIKKYPSSELQEIEYNEIENLEGEDKIINEYCYWIKVCDGILLLIFSGISKNSNISRGYGRDAIRIVPVDDALLKPLRKSFPHIKRVKGWKDNFHKRVTEVLRELHFNMICPKCGSDLRLKKNHKTNFPFLGCIKYPNCFGSRSLRINIK